jgi:GH15 family glucan-1,4-alpha-glucosidase
MDYGEAIRMLERANEKIRIPCQTDVGLLAEQFDPSTGHLTGNFPQAYSHVGLINSALNLSRQAKPAEERQAA